MITRDSSNDPVEVLGLDSDGHVYLIGKNDIIWSFNIPIATFRGYTTAGIYDQAVELYANLQKKRIDEMEIEQKVEIDESFIIKYPQHFRKAAGVLARNGMFSFAKFLISVKLKVVTQSPDMTLGIMYDRIKRETVLVVNPYFVYRTIASDRGQKLNDDEIHAYFLAHECMHLFQGHMAGIDNIPYEHRAVGNPIEDLSINSQLGIAFDIELSAVDTGVISPVCFSAVNNAVEHPDDLTDLGYTFVNDSQLSDDKVVPRGPIIVIVDTKPYDKIDPTKILAFLGKLKPFVSLTGSIDDVITPPEERVPTPEPSWGEIKAGMLVRIKSTKGFGIIEKASPPDEHGIQEFDVFELTPEDADIFIKVQSGELPEAELGKIRLPKIAKPEPAQIPQAGGSEVSGGKQLGSYEPME